MAVVSFRRSGRLGPGARRLDAMANLGVSNALATDDRLRLVDRASANWGV